MPRHTKHLHYAVQMRRQDDEILQNKDTHQLNIRLSQKNFDLLRKVSAETSQTPSTFGSQIVSEWMEVYYCKMRRGDIIFSQPSLKKILESINPSRLDDISEFMANHIVKEIKLQEGDVDYDILSEHILKWNKANHLSLNRIEKKDNQTNEEFDVFLSRHSLGKNWSEIECKTYKKAFEIIGNVVFSCEYDEDMFSLTVRKQI